MKKLNYLLLGLAGLAMASCSQEDLNAPGVDGNVQFTVSLPGISTRAVLGDGTKSLQLDYAVYEATTTDGGEAALGNFVFQGQGAFTEESPLKTQLGMNLVTGRSYYVVFFAQAANNGVYTFDTENKQLSVNYGKMDSDGNLGDLYDCFYEIYPTGEVSGTQSFNVTLYRPVAQINWGTNDLDNSTANQGIVNAFGANGAYIESTLTVNAPNTMDFFSKEVSGNEDVPISIGAFSAPSNAGFSHAFAGTSQYTYIAMQYVLAPQASKIYDLTLTVNNNLKLASITESENDVDVINAPLQANYQTNIYGSLLSDNIIFNIDKGEWTGSYLVTPDMGEEIQDGLFYNASTKTYTIMNSNGLEYYAENIGVSTEMNNGLTGTTVLLGTNINMSNVQHTPFCLAGATFDGQGYTISNLTVDLTEEEGNPSAGFIGHGVGYVQNINFTNATIKGHYNAGVAVGDGIATRINNVHVDGATIISTPWQTASGKYDDGNNVGGIVGYLSAEGTASCTNCSVNDAEITAYRKVGGAVGIANGAAVVTGNTVTNTTVTANQQLAKGQEYVKPYEFEAGEVVGSISATATVENNTTDNVAVITLSSDGNYAVGSASAFLALGNLTKDQYAGKTILLTDDIDMKGLSFTPIFFNNTENRPTIDGQGHTISNIELGPNCPSLFGNGGTGACTMNIENLNIDGLTGNVKTRFAGFISNFYGKLTNVHVKNVNIISTEGRVGAITGIFNEGSATNCSVTDASVTGTWSVGGMFGAINETPGIAITQCNVDNVTVKNTHGFGGVYNNMEGVITGNINISGVVFTDCNITNCGDNTLPVNWSSISYIWNGETIPAN